MNESRTFTLGELFTATELAPVKNRVMFVTALEGWEGHTVEIVTKPKLKGKGSWRVSARVPEQTITVAIQIDSRTYDVRALLENIRATMDTLEPVTATRTFLTSGRTETKSVYIKEIFDDELYSDFGGEFKLTLLNINP